MKSLNILWPDNTNIETKGLVENLINTFQDFSYGYDLVDEAHEVIEQYLTENDIPYEWQDNDYDDTDVEDTDYFGIGVHNYDPDIDG